jgi:DNA-binding transcriptional ArsR family regulator
MTILDPRTNEPILKIQQKIYDFLAQPQTLYDISKGLDVSYHTIRRHLMRLEYMGLVEDTGLLRNKSKVYIRVGEKVPTIPAFHNIATNQYMDAQTFLQIVGHPEQTTTHDAINNLINSLAELFYYANLARNGLDVTPELHQLRKGLQKDYIQVQSFHNILRQLLENPTWWDPSKLKTICEDDNYDPTLVNTAYNKVLQQRKQHARLPLDTEDD